MASPGLKSQALRVGIDGRLLTHYEMRGLPRHCIELFGAMKKIFGDRLELLAFSPEPPAPEFRALLDITPVVFSAAREILWEQVELPRQLRRNAVDIFHVTGNRGLPYRHVCKYIVTCHDIIDRLPEFCAGEHWRGRMRKAYADNASRHSADRYITVSEFSQRDICRFHRVSPERVVVIYNAASERFHQRLSADRIEQVRDKHGLPAEYFLFLGGFDQRKNVAKLVEAFAQLPGDVPPLVLAGEHKWEFAAVCERIAALRLHERIICPGAIDDEDLPALYQGAMALVHPSLYEGFGLQLVEAMASGIPVLASDATSIPEVLGGCGLLFDPNHPASIAAAMQRILSDVTLRHQLIEDGRQRARAFSWHNAAEQTLNLYYELLGRGSVFSGCAAQEQAQ